MIIFMYIVDTFKKSLCLIEIKIKVSTLNQIVVSI